MDAIASGGLKRKFEDADVGSPASNSDDEISNSDSADSCDSVNPSSSSGFIREWPRTGMGTGTVPGGAAVPAQLSPRSSLSSWEMASVRPRAFIPPSPYPNLWVSERGEQPRAAGTSEAPSTRRGARRRRSPGVGGRHGAPSGLFFLLQPRLGLVLPAATSILKRQKQLRRKNVRFDQVTVYYFARRQGFTSVPSQGGSSLGMAQRHNSVRRYTLCEFAQEQEVNHREILREHLKEEKLHAKKMKVRPRAAPCLGRRERTGRGGARLLLRVDFGVVQPCSVPFFLTSVATALAAWLL